MSEDTQRKTWEEFEEITFKVLLELFNLEENKWNQLTKSTKDGGYDGVFWIPLQTNDSTYFLHAIFEAKLRTDTKSALPLQDFAKALIIAINRDADRIIIASNLILSSNTCNILENFSNQTGLQIQFLSISEIMRWLDNHSSEQKEYSKDILELLDKSFNDNRFKTTSLKQIELCSNTKPIELFSEKHKQKRKFLVNLINTNNFHGIIIIKGNVGSGKTTFIRGIHEKLSNIKIKIEEVDLTDIPTPRVLFTRIMENIWKIPIEFINSIPNEDFEHAISWIGTEYISDDIKNVVNIAFKKSQKEYNESADIFNYFLVTYLKLIYSQLGKKRKFVISFLNLNKASKEVLDFLLQFAKVMSPYITIILELRTSYYVDGYIETEEWEKYLDEFSKLNNVKGIYTPEKLEAYEYCNYMSYIYEKKFPEKCANVVLEKAGHSLLLINAYIGYLKCENFETTPEILKKQKIESIPIGDPENILSMLCNSLCKKDSYYIKLFYLSVIFQGEILVKIIEETIAYDTQKIDYILKKTDIFQLINSKLKVKHLCYLDLLKEGNYIGETLRQELAKTILNKKILTRYVQNEENQKIIQIELYEILSEDEKLITSCLSFSREMFAKEQYFLSRKYIEKAEKKVSFLTKLTLSQKIEKIHIFILLLQNELLEHQLDENRIHDLIDKIEIIFDECKRSECLHYCDYDETYLNYLLVKNTVFHIEGNYKETLTIMNIALLFLQENAFFISENTKAQCWLAYAIAVKENYSIPKCLEVFRTARRECPHHYGLLYSNLTHISEKYSTYNPRIALKCLYAIQSFETNLSMASIFHNRINIAVMQMYLGYYSSALMSGREILQEVNQYGLRGEESRCCNLLGCLYLIEGDYKQAKTFLNHGIDLLNRKKQITTLWPLLSNLSSLLMQQELWYEVYDILIECKNIYIKNYSQRINHFQFTEKKYPKLFAAVLLLYENLLLLKDSTNIKNIDKDISAIESNFTSVEFINHFQKIRNGNKMTDIFSNTPFLHNGCIIIKT